MTLKGEHHTEETKQKLHDIFVGRPTGRKRSDAVPLFVPLCNKCHSKTNFNREYWKEHFTNMINTYYGGKCYLSKNEMSSMSPNGIIMVGV